MMRSLGMSVMSANFCPLPGSWHSAHGQLSRSHVAGKHSLRPPTTSASRSDPAWSLLVTVPPDAAPPWPRRPGFSKVGYTSMKMTILLAVVSRQRVIIVGGGVLGTMHAVAARRRGFEVVQLEREAEARGASVRNFGLVWVSGRRAGPELALALRARALWAGPGAAPAGPHFPAAGSRS